MKFTLRLHPGPVLHRLLPASQFLELCAAFRSVFGSDVPQQAFSYLLAEKSEILQRRKQRQRLVLQQVSWDAPSTGVVQSSPVGGYASSTLRTSAEEDSADIGPVELRVRLRIPVNRARPAHSAHLIHVVFNRIAFSPCALPWEERWLSC